MWKWFTALTGLSVLSVLLMGGLVEAEGFEAPPPPFVVAVVHRTQGVLGTGVSIARGLVLTNHHVVVSNEQNSATEKFSPFSEADLSIVSGHARMRPVLRIHRPSQKAPDHFAGLDYAFLEIGGEPIDVVVPSTSMFAFPLSLVGWSDIVFRTTQTRIAKQVGHLLLHCNETQPGFSGGPVLNASGDLVALHKGVMSTNEVKCKGGVAAYSIPIPRIFETVGTNIPSVVPILKERLGISETPH
jgi:hypothetical protein